MLILLLDHSSLNKIVDISLSSDLLLLGSIPIINAVILLSLCTRVTLLLACFVAVGHWSRRLRVVISLDL
jgi:hypothetical protein